MQSASKKAEVLEEILNTKKNLEKQKFTHNCTTHLGQSQNFICMLDSSVLCTFCINDHCLDSLCIISTIAHLKARFKEELNSLYDFLSIQNPVRFGRIDPLITNLKKFLYELNKNLRQKRSLEIENAKKLTEEKQDDAMKNYLNRENPAEIKPNSTANSLSQARKRSNSLESVRHSSLENSGESENLNLNEADYFSNIKNSMKKSNAELEWKSSLSAGKTRVNVDANFSVKDFISDALISKEYLEPFDHRAFHKNLNLTEKLKGSKSNLIHNKNNSNSNLKEKNDPDTEAKDEELFQLNSQSLKIINNFLNENFQRKLSIEISLNLDEKYELRFKGTDKFIKRKLKKLILEREAQEKILMERTLKKRTCQPCNDEDSSNSKVEENFEGEGEEMNFFEVAGNFNKRKNLRAAEEKEKDFDANKHSKMNSIQEEKEDEDLLERKSEKIMSEKAYLKNFKKLLKEKFLTIKQESVESDYVIKEKEYFYGHESNNVYGSSINAIKSKFEILREIESPIENNLEAQKVYTDNGPIYPADEGNQVSYKEFLREIEFNPGRNNQETDEYDENQGNKYTKNSFDNPVTKLNNSDFVLKANNVFLDICCEETIQMEESKKLRKNTALSTNEILKLNLSNFESKNEKRKFFTKILNDVYASTTEKLIETQESNNVETNSADNYNSKATTDENVTPIPNFYKNQNSYLDEKTNIKVASVHEALNESSNSDSCDISNSKRINIFADSESDEEADKEKALGAYGKIPNDNFNFDKAKNKPTDKKENIISKKFNNINNKISNGKADAPIRDEEKAKKELKDIIRKESIQTEQAIKIENKNEFYSAKGVDCPSKKINFLDFQEPKTEKNDTEKKAKIIKSNIFNKNNNENESFEMENSANVTIDLNNPKADLNFTSNYKANIGENNLIDNTNIQEQTNIKSIIQALDSRILKSAVQAEKKENNKEQTEALNKIKNNRKISENLKSNCSQIFNDTYIIHLVNDNEKSEDEEEDNLEHGNKAKESGNSRRKTSVNNQDEKNKIVESDAITKQSGDTLLCQKPGYNMFLMTAQKIIEEAKIKNAAKQTDLNGEKKMKVINSCIQNIQGEATYKNSVESFNFTPAKDSNLDNNNNNNLKFKSNINFNLTELDQPSTTSKSNNLNFGSLNNQANVNNNTAFNNVQNIYNKNPAYNSNLNNTNLGSLVNDLNNNTVINNPNNNNNNFANLENLKNTIESKISSSSQNNLNPSMNSANPSDPNNQQVIQLLQTLLQSQNNSNSLNHTIMNNMNSSNMNGFSPINNPAFMNNFGTNPYENFNLNMLGNSMNPFNNNNNANNINMINLMLQQMPNSPLKELVVQILNSRNMQPNQTQMPMNFPNNNPIQHNLNVLLNGNKNFNNFPMQNNAFNQYNMSNNNNMFNNNVNLNSQNQNNNLLKLIELLNPQKSDAPTNANNPINSLNFNNIPNNNYCGVNNQNQFNIQSNKDVNFPWKNQNQINMHSQIRNIINDRNYNNYNNLNLPANLNLNILNNNSIPPINQNLLNPTKENKGISINKEDDYGKSLYAANNEIKETENCKFSKTRISEESKKVTKLKITSMLSEKKYSKLDYS